MFYFNSLILISFSFYSVCYFLSNFCKAGSSYNLFKNSSKFLLVSFVWYTFWDQMHLMFFTHWYTSNIFWVPIILYSSIIISGFIAFLTIIKLSKLSSEYFMLNLMFFYILIFMYKLKVYYSTDNDKSLTIVKYVVP